MANTYPTLQAVALEQVQNALDHDVQATRISILVNYKTKRLAITDNGKGISVDTFNKVLTSIADPSRSRQMHKDLGQFAIGLASPLGKCEYYTFTSCPDPQLSLFNEWTFRCKEIEEEGTEINVPVRSRPELTLSTAPTRGQARVPWRTKIELFDFDDDNIINRIEMDDLVVAIQDRFSATMRKNKVIISIRIIQKDGSEENRPNVQAPQFRGQKLPKYETESTDAGKVHINLFVSPKIKGARTGRVVMGTFGSDFRFPFHYFARSASQLLPEEVITALSSGVFEGEIVASHVKLHANREAFIKDDAYVGLCIEIETWFGAHGKRYLKEIKESQQETRYQELGLKSLKVIENLLRSQKFVNLLKVIKSFKRGIVGAGHKNPAPKNVVEKQDKPSLSLDGNPGESRQPDPNTEPRDRENSPSEEKKDKIHPTVTGPRGQVRRVVKHSSFGLQFTHEPKEGSRQLWDLDIEDGILSFNSRHPLWEACEPKDKTLMQLQEYVAIQALTLYAMPEHFRAQQREVLDELCYSFVEWLLNADKARSSTRNSSAK